ncbi:MAG: VWA domain-containing protein [Verrucomicrobiales bacterium]
MKIDCRLDYSTILANQGRPVHLAVGLRAGQATAEQRRALAFCVVLDRSGSMSGKPLEDARAACETVVRNLRATDQLALVVFDDQAQVIIPMQAIADKAKAIAAIRAIREGGSTNLTAGWMLGRDELGKTAAGTARRILLLTDGHLNVGIVEPGEVARIVADGLERGQVRTSTLGFADNYDETLLERVATCSGGNFYDANSPDKLPAIFAAELEGLQKIAAQNVRIRFRTLTFCEGWKLLASYHSVALPDGRTEISLGDLVSDEAATVVFGLEVLPLPVLEDGQPVASLEGEALVELEILWDDLPGSEITSCNHLQTIRILGTQNPEDVKVNVDVIPSVATQRTGLAMAEALQEAKEGRSDRALIILRETVRQLTELGHDDKMADGLAAMNKMIARLEADGELDARYSKEVRYSSSHRRKMKSQAMWSTAEAAPGYSESSIPTPPPPADPTDPSGDPQA